MSEEIKYKCQLEYKRIKDAERNLEQLRNECKHYETEKANYSYRVGATHPSIVCVHCGKVVGAATMKISSKE